MIFSHPNPTSDTFRQVGGAWLAALMALAGAAALLFGLGDSRLRLMIPVAVAVWALVAPVLMLAFASPAVEVTAEALVVHSRVSGRRSVPWAAIAAIKDDPLLPSENGEAVRRVMVGRRKYQPPRGRLLVIPSLPLPYRFLGLFAGEGLTGALAITSRTHRDYDRAISEIERRWNAARQ